MRANSNALFWFFCLSKLAWVVYCECARIRKKKRLQKQNNNHCLFCDFFSFFFCFLLYTEDVVCLNEDFEEVYFKLSQGREDVYKKVTETIESGQAEGKDVYVTVLEGPMKQGNQEPQILQIITEAKAVNPQ